MIKDGHSLVNGTCNVLSHDSRSDDIGLCSIFSVIVTSMMIIIKNYWLTREFNFCIIRFNKFQQKNRGIPLSLLTLCGNSFVLIHHSKQLQDRGNNRSNHHPAQFHSQHQHGNPSYTLPSMLRRVVHLPKPLFCKNLSPFFLFYA